MGEPPQKRLIRKLDLERFLSQIKPFSSPNVALEQYAVSEAVAATMLYIAAYNNNDIVGKSVLDLGCGTGRLSLAASFLGAKSVVGIDIDKTAVKTALKNSKQVELSANVQWIAGEIDVIIGRFDTVLQNPPFGVQKRAADRKFLQKALEVGCSVYSLHNHPVIDKRLSSRLKANAGGLLQVSPSPFLERFIKENNGAIKAVYALPMSIPHMFDFHTKNRHDFVVDLYVIKKNS